MLAEVLDTLISDTIKESVLKYPWRRWAGKSLSIESAPARICRHPRRQVQLIIDNRFKKLAAAGD